VLREQAQIDLIPDTYYLSSPSILVSRPPSTVSRLPSPVSGLPIRPNTTLFYTLFTSYAMAAGQLKYKGEKRFTKEYSDNSVTEAILGIGQFGARIGFEGVRSSIPIHPNLSSAFEYPDVVTAEIEAKRKRNRLRNYCSYNTVPGYFIASPLGLTDNISRKNICVGRIGSMSGCTEFVWIVQSAQSAL